MGIINVDSDAIGRLLITYFAFVKYWRKNGNTMKLYTEFKKTYDSVRREVLYNILIEFGVPKKLVRLVKMCLTKMYSRVRVGKNMSDMFPIRNGLNREMLYRHCFSTLLWSMQLGGFW